MTPRAGFLTAILENPADDVARLAYADWLRESPDAFDRAHGRFLAAGLALHRAPEPEEGNEGPYYEALREQNETALRVLGVQARHLLGAERLATEWGWDNDAARPDRVTLAAIPPRADAAQTDRERRDRRRRPRPRDAIVWERGCVAEVRLPLATWAAWGARLLHLCPLERVHLHEVPGLVIHVERNPEAGWYYRGELKLPKVVSNPALAALFPEQTVGGTYPIVGVKAHARAMMVRNAWDWADRLLRHLRGMAGARWPGPGEWDEPHPDDTIKAREGLGLD